MKVTPINKKFGKHRPGDVFELPDKTAKLFIKLGKLEAAPVAPVAPLTYQTRALQAAPAESPAVAPYGYKADGTPRLRPAPRKQGAAVSAPYVEGCRKELASGQHWIFCGETDMGQSLPALCTDCGGDFVLDQKAND